MPFPTTLVTIQTIRHGRVIDQKHQAVLIDPRGSDNLPALIERPTLNALQKAVEAAGGGFQRNAIKIIKHHASDDE